MNPEDAVLDEIDRLVDESLAKPYSERSGYDNDINQPGCRCGADWHGLPQGGCPGSDAEGPLGKDPVFRGNPLDPNEWIPLGRIEGDGPRFTYAPEFSFSAPQWPPIGPTRGGLFNRASEIFPEIFAELSVTFQNLTTAVEANRERLGTWQETPEEPQTPQQRALPRPSITPPMWAPRADGRRRH